LEQETYFLYEDLDLQVTTSLISYIPNLKIVYFDYSGDISYTNFTGVFHENSCKYALINILEVDEEFMTKLEEENDFIVLFENSEYIFSKLKYI